MEKHRRFSATIRCRTWNTWPELQAISSGGVQLTDKIAGIDAATVCYLQRSEQAEYADEPTTIGSLIWRGEVPGRYFARGSILVAPEDITKIELRHDHPRRGEIDVCVVLTVPGKELIENAKSILGNLAWALLALLNLRLNECLTPIAPLQFAWIVEGEGRQFEDPLYFLGKHRSELSAESIADVVRNFSKIAGARNEKLCTALELYGSHFAEKSAKIRFLLLVMALEVLAVPDAKHAAAQHLIDKWREDIEAAKSHHDAKSEAHWT